MEEHKTALAALMQACQQQAQEKKQVLDQTFGKYVAGDAFALKMLANRTAEEQAQMAQLEKAEQKSSSSSDDDEDKQPFKLKEALKLRRKEERKRKAAQRKFEKLMSAQRTNASIESARAEVELATSSEGTVSEDSEDYDENQQSFATDKAVIQGSMRSEKSTKLITTGKSRLSSPDSSDSDDAIDALTGARHSKRYQNMLAEQRRKGQFDPLVNKAHVAGKGTFFESNDFVKLKAQMLQKKQQADMQTKAEAQALKLKKKKERREKQQAHQDHLFESLMNGISAPEEEKKPELGLLESRQEARFSSADANAKMDGLSVEKPVAKPGMLSEEEQKALFDRREKEKIELRKKQVRFENRKSFDELLQKLLNGDIFDLFADRQSYFPQLPLTFAGHWEYLEIWEHLFTFELYSMMLNSRRSDSKDEKPHQAGLEGRGDRVSSSKQFMHVGYSVLGKQACGMFQPLRVYKQPPFSKNINATDDSGKAIVRQLCQSADDEAINRGFNMRHIKDHDLVLLSAEKLPTPGTQHDIKRMANAEFIRSLLIKQCAMFAFVTQKNIGSPKDPTQAGASIDVLIDHSKATWLKLEEQTSGYSKLHVYLYESLATTFREYKTLRMSEFYGMSSILMNPSLQAQETAQQAEARSLKEGEDVKAMRAKMESFYETYKTEYNQSQCEVLRRVCQMPDDDVLLIQGPPGTGKTHTITGIISMLLASGARKIHVCAPSNAAVDEILARLSTFGLMGITKDREELKKYFLRIGSFDYEPQECIKPHLLDNRLQEQLTSERVYSLKEQITLAEELLGEIQKGFKLDFQNNRHRLALQKVVTSNIKKMKTFLGKPIQSQKAEIQKEADKCRRFLSDIENQRADGKSKGDWKYAENSLILKTPVICTTLSMAGIERLEIARGNIDYLIIDEACQAIEPSCLIPFNLEPKRVILVGDQNQLPATTYSDNAMETNFARSLFERLLLGGYKKTMLTIQYRMHPLIRKFPSDKFYEGRITDGQNTITRKLDSQMQALSAVVRRSVFFDLCRAKETMQNSSRVNMDEIRFTLNLVRFIALTVGKGRSFHQSLAGKIAVITPYKAQVQNLKNAFGPWLRSIGCQLSDIEINTVDAFQGREKDIVIFNCVRSNTLSSIQGSLGFLTDVRRLNVAITRPRHFLFMVGNSQTLLKCETWAEMIDQHRICQASGAFLSLDQKCDYYSDQVIADLVHKQSDPAKRQAELAQSEKVVQQGPGKVGKAIQNLMQRASDQLGSKRVREEASFGSLGGDPTGFKRARHS